MTTKTLVTLLPLCYKEYFESKLAVTLLDHPELFPVVSELSHLIYHFLRDNRDAVILQIEREPKIMLELYGEPYFGRLSPVKSEMTAQHVLSHMLDLLKNVNSKLKQIMQLHAIFVHRIYKPLADSQLKHSIELIEQKYACDTVFTDRDRGRKEKSLPLSLNRQQGVTRDEVFCNLIDEDDQTHASGIDRFERKQGSDLDKQISSENMPFAAGTSSHTASYMLLANVLGKFNNEKLQEYAMACFAFLAAGGNHTFHEVMMTARVSYQVNDYLSSIPVVIQTSDALSQLREEFPQLLTQLGEEDKTSVYKIILEKVGFMKSLHRVLVEKFSGESRVAGLVLRYV